MTPQFGPVFGVVVVLFCLAYFSIASFTFLFVRLDIPEVWRLFRGLFHTYFWVIPTAGLVATATFAISGPVAFAAAMLVLSAAIVAVRAPLLQLIDTKQAAGRSGDAAAMRRLRLIHLSCMAVNVAIIASVASSLPSLF